MPAMTLVLLQAWGPGVPGVAAEALPPHEAMGLTPGWAPDALSQPVQGQEGHREECAARSRPPSPAWHRRHANIAALDLPLGSRDQAAVITLLQPQASPSLH
ncbi:hypothetical protein KIL84_002848 [Mauremys mutica]|uniref:Uncharacterized protein n=1 Tax=Mauremys mutica TaxID=74926 RepID=A0A9D3WV24_9SAUR|nr:hypothetical protein KIL84_002848 [Mauremys mutica]